MTTAFIRSMYGTSRYVDNLLVEEPRKAERRRQRRFVKMEAALLRAHGHTTAEIAEWQGCTHQMASIRSRHGALLLIAILRSVRTT